jgi:hypothetical protein
MTKQRWPARTRDAASFNHLRRHDDAMKRP